MQGTQKTALITGITGQAGSYLAELLLSKGYAVSGIVRRSSSFNTGRIDHIFDRLDLHYGDVTDGVGLMRTLLKVRPDEFYNLAAQSHVRVSFDQPLYTADTVAMAVGSALEAIRTYKEVTDRDVRFYQASSSELFGSSPAPQNERTPFKPQSPYAVSKLFAHEMAGLYRRAYGLHVSCGILFNHESPRRGETFVTRKLTRAAARIKLGLQETVTLGNLDATRDWGFAGDYVTAIWMMLQRDEPDDFCIGTGISTSVRQFGEKAFAAVGLNFADHVRTDSRYIRPAEVDELRCDPAKALTVLKWGPTTRLGRLIEMMIEHDLELAEREKRCLT